MRATIRRSDYLSDVSVGVGARPSSGSPLESRRAWREPQREVAMVAGHDDLPAGPEDTASFSNCGNLEFE